uniref:G-patch domain-containing protein n=1 Tax=Panagrolaimus sp. PS1159 TaxID=55785 RepID=A0AC35EXY8_9BILA
MSKKSGGRYGTAFEEIEDESGPIKKRPKRVHEEVVTDERGRRRFHGAFTGGFSAGYFNSVGSKHGFVPQTFISSRDRRADVQQLRAEDFMDDEDFGEFGIASRTFHVNRMYTDSGKPEGQAIWDRPSAAAATASSDATAGALSDFFKVSTKVETSISIGFKIMKKMGYREGKGIGAPLTRRQLELQKLHEERARGKKSRFDKTAVEEADEFAAGFEFIPEDIPPIYFTCKENDHGLGYQPLKGLSDGYQSTPKETRSKRGEAFGVGAFEDSDEDIYDTNDMSKYTFELTNKLDIDPMLAITSGKPTFTTNFVPAKNPRKKPPRLTLNIPAGFNPIHKPIPFDSSKLPSNVLSYSSSMTPFERAMILGEKNISVLDMLNKEDREKLINARRIAEEKKSQQPLKQEVEEDPFIEDDEKSYRFKKYIQCLKRGVPCGKPESLSNAQWQVEEEEFQNAIPSQLRYLLPDVKERKQPLYKGDFAKSIMEQMKSKFTTTDDNKVTAVKPTALEPFIQHQWHPSKRLCKRLKVADPFPESNMEGIFGGKSKSKTLKGAYEFTRSKVEEELSNRYDKNHHHIKEEPKESVFQTDASTVADPLLNFLDLMDKVYGTNEEEIKEGEKLEKEYQKPAPKPRQLSPALLPPSKPKEQPKHKSIFDAVEDEVPYGPEIPSELKNKSNQTKIKDEVVEENLNVEARKLKDTNRSRSSSESEDGKRRSRSSKKHKKEHKKRHKEKKSKHKKKESKKPKKSSSKERKRKKDKHRSRSSSTSSSSSIEIVS